MVRNRGKRHLAWTVLAGLVASCTNAPLPSSVALSPPPEHPNGQALWRIVDQKCVPGQLRSGDPIPCAAVSIVDGRERGYAVLKDRAGVAQYLVMPTILISGIEDSRVSSANSPNYFAAAWQARGLVSAKAGTHLHRDEIGIAVNSQYGRSQDLLHLHVDCVRQDVRKALREITPTASSRWSSKPVTLAARAFYIRRLEGTDNITANPFLLVQTGFHIPKDEMKAWTIFLTGADFAGHPGFLLLAARADPANGNRGASEILLDHQCAVAKNDPPSPNEPVP